MLSTNGCSYCVCTMDNRKCSFNKSVSPGIFFYFNFCKNFRYCFFCCCWNSWAMMQLHFWHDKQSMSSLVLINVFLTAFFLSHKKILWIYVVTDVWPSVGLSLSNDDCLSVCEHGHERTCNQNIYVGFFLVFVSEINLSFYIILKRQIVIM